MKSVISVIVVLVSGVVVAGEIRAEAQVNLTPGPVSTRELVEAVNRADQALFEAVFDTCDTDALAKMVTEDLEFFHDKHGLSSTSGEEFVTAIRGKCQRQRDGEDFLSRREIVPESVRVYPLKDYGAIQVGEHRFYAVVAGKSDRLVETGRFTMVWHDDNGTWRLARVLSYDHVLVD